MTPSDTEARMLEMYRQECEAHGSIPVDPESRAWCPIRAAMLRARNEAIEECEKVVAEKFVDGNDSMVEVERWIAIGRDIVTAIRQLKDKA